MYIILRQINNLRGTIFFLRTRENIFNNNLMIICYNDKSSFCEREREIYL